MANLRTREGGRQAWLTPGSSSAAARRCTTLRWRAKPGADAFGMIFAPSPRRIAFEAPQEIARRVPAGNRAGCGLRQSEHARSRCGARALSQRAACSFRATRRRSSSDAMASARSKRFTSTTARARVEERCERYPQACCSSMRAKTEWPAAPAGRSIGVRPRRSPRSGASSLRADLQPENVGRMRRARASVRGRRAYRHRDRRPQGSGERCRLSCERCVSA